MGSINQIRHLELLKNNGEFFIKINSLKGRLSLFADHPQYKLKDALNFKINVHRTSGQLSLVGMKQKGLYILQDTDSKGNNTQNLIYVDDELSQSMSRCCTFTWFREHLFDFFTRSISVSFLILYMVYFFAVMRYYNTTGTLRALRYITGVVTLGFAVAFYYLRSVHTKSSLLKFCFKTELCLFIIIGTINNIVYLMDFNNATDTF